MLKVGRNELIVGNRDKWIIENLKKLPAGSKLIDIGAGQCPFKKHCAHLDYTSQDFAQYEGFWDDQIQEGSADKNRIDIVCDILSIPVADNSFDSVMCTEVLEHVPEPIKALSEISRILRPGGTLILTAPFASYSHFEPFHFASGFNRFFYEHHLPKLGYTILDLQMNGNYYEYIALKIRWLSDIAAKHSNASLNIMDKLSIRGILRTLQRFSNQDKTSNSFLNNGVFVLAVKETSK